MPSPIPSIKYQGSKPTHDTRGLPGYPAVDIMATAGTVIVAPEDGHIFKVSGHDPKTGVHGSDVFGWSVYLQGVSGKRYYLTHMGTREVRFGMNVKAGQVLGTVGLWPGDPSRSHLHFGVEGGNAALIASDQAPYSSSTPAETGAASQATTPAATDTAAAPAPALATIGMPQDMISPSVGPQLAAPGTVRADGYDPSRVAQLWAQVASLPNASPDTQQTALYAGQVTNAPVA